MEECQWMSYCTCVLEVHPVDLIQLYLLYLQSYITQEMTRLLFVTVYNDEVSIASYVVGVFGLNQEVSTQTITSERNHVLY